MATKRRRVLTGQSGEDGGKKNRRRERLSREGRWKEIRTPAAAFIEGARRSHTSRIEDQWGKEQPSPAPWSGEKLEAPTSFDSHARCTRALNLHMRRHIRPVHNGTVVSTPRASRLKRGTLKSYVRVVPSRASGARPPANPEQELQGGLRRAQILSRPTPWCPHVAPEISSKAVSVRRRLRLARPYGRSKTFRGKKPQAMATYVLEVARLTHKVGSNSRLRITERRMTEDEHNRGHGQTPLGDRRIFTSCIRDPCGCHATGIPSREAPSPRNLENGFDIHRDCPRVF
jgi:hypothetical protein